MLDIAWPELVVIGAVALVAIGPKDLPKVMRSLGRLAGKARTLMQDFQRNFEQLNYETEVAEKLRTEQEATSKPESPHDRSAS
ncbi:MAG: Sec-independent protein translocase protein TatB [Alphaproteobacteria bacterium]